MDDERLTAVITAIKQSKKYGDTSEETIRELSITALQQHKKPKAAIKAVRTRLHGIMAPYLGDPVYDEAMTALTAVFPTNDRAQINATCADILDTHLSTRERQPLLPAFYDEIFAVTGKPKTLLDLACGLNPLAFPWMGLDGDTTFYAYDIHEPRIALLNGYFRLEGLPEGAILQDIAHHFPEEEGDVALFLKEMPRYSRNYGNLGRPLLEALRVRWLVLSFPAVSAHGGRKLDGRYREFMHQLIDGHDWPITELLFGEELVFCIDKSNELHE